MPKNLFPERLKVEIRIHPIYGISEKDFPFIALRNLPVNLMEKYHSKSISNIEREVSIVSSCEGIKYLISDTGILENGERKLIGVADYSYENLQEIIKSRE